MRVLHGAVLDPCDHLLIFLSFLRITPSYLFLNFVFHVRHFIQMWTSFRLVHFLRVSPHSLPLGDPAHIAWCWANVHLSPGTFSYTGMESNVGLQCVLCCVSQSSPLSATGVTAFTALGRAWARWWAGSFFFFFLRKTDLVFYKRLFSNLIKYCRGPVSVGRAVVRANNHLLLSPILRPHCDRVLRLPRRGESKPQVRLLLADPGWATRSVQTVAFSAQVTMALRSHWKHLWESGGGPSGWVPVHLCLYSGDLQLWGRIRPISSDDRPSFEQALT